MYRVVGADGGILLNHLSNLKLKSGIGPVCDLRKSQVRLGLSSDNCNSSYVQSAFQAMKLVLPILAGQQTGARTRSRSRGPAPHHVGQCADGRPQWAARPIARHMWNGPAGKYFLQTIHHPGMVRAYVRPQRGH